MMGWTTGSLRKLGEGNRVFEANMICRQVKQVLGSAWIFIACIAGLSISMSKILDELWSKQWWRWMAKGEVCHSITVGIFFGRDWERKAEGEIPEKTLSILETSVSLQNPWKTKQKNYGKIINCRSTNLDFPSPHSHCQIIYMANKSWNLKLVLKLSARTHLVTMQVCEFFINCGLYLTPFIRKQKSHHKTEKININSGEIKKEGFWLSGGKGMRIPFWRNF